MYNFLSGSVSMGCLAIGLFFIRFWKSTNDRFFLMFAFAFWIMSLDRLILVLLNNSEYSYSIYILRLLSFILIIIAIIDKNRKKL